MKIAFRTDSGLVRENNEDWYIVDEELQLFLVADGVGGHQAGEVASKLGSKTIQDIIKNKLSVIQPGEDIESILKEAIDAAHTNITSAALKDPDLSGMASTVVLGLYYENDLYIAHVGDSRAYLINFMGITSLKEDHSLVANLVKRGKITPQEARKHKMRNIITQCLGSNDYHGPEIRKIALGKSDIILLCSDGLTDMLEDEEMRCIVMENKHDLHGSVNKMIEMAYDRGGIDNITLILVEKSDNEMRSILP